MALADKVNNPPKRQRKCSFKEWKLGLPETEREAVDTMMADRRWSTTALTEAFQEAGCPVGYMRVTDHRLGKCNNCK